MLTQLIRFIHAAGIFLFTKGFLLTRLVLEDHSTCHEPPIEPRTRFIGQGTPEAGCWHPKTFDKAVVVIIDALRYDFTIPFNSSDRFSAPQLFHNNIPFLYETAIKEPQNAFLLPFIADPPTTTLQRLKGLTTGTLPTFIDAGSNFAGTAIEEDNLLIQLEDAGKRIVHLGDDTWTALFPGYFKESLSRAYDSLNVWDLHTVDNGVNEHLMPILAGEVGKDEWDVIFAHYLGVDHAGHRYGPSHAAMAQKLQQMDAVVREMVEKLDDDTLLVIMGDHGMDSKGDHGGESDDEVEAALWMYSKKGVFGRVQTEHVTPPQTAKERPVGQIDLVPTLALLLGLPIPFNNLGTPIREAFIGKNNNAWPTLAEVSRMTAAAVKRYQAAYYKARGIEEGTLLDSPATYWEKAVAGLPSNQGNRKDAWMFEVDHFGAYQARTLEICKGLWARFDIPNMIQGVMVLAAGLLVLLLYVKNNTVEEEAVEAPPELPVPTTELEKELHSIETALAKSERAKLEKQKAEAKEKVVETDFTESTVTGAAIGTVAGALLGLTVAQLNPDGSLLNDGILGAAAAGLVGALAAQIGSVRAYGNPLPRSIWGWMSLLFTVSQSIGFASNSYTIWEDSILLFFLSTFGIIAAIASARQQDLVEKTLAIYHSLMFVVLGWIASFSRLCREEQMPYCRSTYYASSTSSTSAPWQLIIPFVVAILLPSIVSSFYTSTKNYAGWAPIWISVVFRAGLFSAAVFWAMNAADDGEWFPWLGNGTLKNARVVLAQTIFALSLAAGTTAFAWAQPCVTITTTAPPPGSSRKNAIITVLGYANTHGSRYFLLLTSLLLSCILVQKPMGWLSLSLCTWQILSLLEILDRLNLKSNSSIGPIILAHLASFHFFKTGHQATLSSIQWESAFIPLHTISYPWSPLLVILNTFGSHILCLAAVPLVVLWKAPARQDPKTLANSVFKALAWFVVYAATENLATTMWAGHLRRHLMLYRIFSPRWMVGCAVLLVTDLCALGVGLAAWVNGCSVADVFGWS